MSGMGSFVRKLEEQGEKMVALEGVVRAQGELIHNLLQWKQKVQTFLKVSFGVPIEGEEEESVPIDGEEEPDHTPNHCPTPVILNSFSTLLPPPPPQEDDEEGEDEPPPSPTPTVRRSRSPARQGSSNGHPQKRGKRELSESSTCTLSLPPKKKKYPIMSHNYNNSQKVKLEIDPDAPCAVCASVDVEDNNNILFCDKCNVAVHQACYGIPKVPAGKWFCNPCSDGLDTKSLSCRFCPLKGGALKPVISPSMTTWAHVWCTWWVPEVIMKSKTKQEPVMNVANIEKARFKLRCKVCKLIQGAPIQCANSRCKVAFHPSCAQKEKLRMDMIDSGGENELRFYAYCNNHRNL